MAIGLLVVCHNDIGTVLVKTAISMIGGCPFPYNVVEVAHNCDTQKLCEEIEKQYIALDQGMGVLVLTDCYGATPCNMVCSLRKSNNIRIVTGINLPMLVRVFNYPKLDLRNLADKALSGGRDGITAVTLGK